MKTNVFSYFSYKAFLKDYFAEKAKSRSFSFRSFAMKCGLSSPNHIQQILSSESRISNETLDKLLKGLSLQKEEERYFRRLVEFNQSLEGRNLNFKTTAEEDYFFWSRWYYVVIWELASTRNFRLTAENVVKALGQSINLGEAQSAIDSLISQGYLTSTSEPHVYKQSKPVILASLNAESETDKVIAEEAHRFFIKLSEQMLLAPPSENQFRGLTIAVSEARWNAARQKINLFIEELQTLLANDSDADRVVRLNVNLFTVTKN
jgi:uncharacterized protein (TIGR02147 family)